MVVGDGAGLHGEPFPTNNPLVHEPEYHLIVAPTAIVPPLVFKDNGVPEQTVVDGETVKPVGSLE